MKKFGLVRKLLLLACVYVWGCSGAPAKATDAGSSESVEDMDGAEHANVSSDDPMDGDGENGSEMGTEEKAGSATDARCNGKDCAQGESCIEYVGFTGQPLYTCGIPCKEGNPNDGCPEDMVCQVAPDGPTQCVKK